MTWYICLLLVTAHLVASQNTTSIPEYVLKYAPLVYLDVNEHYYPSDLAAQLTNTYPTIGYSRITDGPSNLSLSDLSDLNSIAGCSSFNSCNLYLTSKDIVTVSPPSPKWLYGTLPNPVTGETEGATSCVVIINNRGNNVVDAFYMYFYAFNEGIPVGSPDGTIYDDHVGDWEHNMIRFVNEQPSLVWYSQHSAGEAYTYNATIKNGSRPLAFSSRGGHASYAQEGQHVMYNGVANDSTSRGPLWDPVAGSGAWYYEFIPNSTTGSGQLIPVNVGGRTSRGAGPTSFLYYFGRWGDKQYNASYPGQQFLGNITSVFTDGPTGPLDKDLVRNQVCPDRIAFCVTTSSIPPASGTVEAQTVSRTYASQASTSAIVSGSASASQSAASRSTGSRNADRPSYICAACICSSVLISLLQWS